MYVHELAQKEYEEWLQHMGSGEMESRPSSIKFKFGQEAKKVYAFVMAQVRNFSKQCEMTNGQADKHIIEHWSSGSFENRGIVYPGNAYLESKSATWTRDRFDLERYRREDNESEGKVSTSSFLLFQTKLYCRVRSTEVAESHPN